MDSTREGMAIPVENSSPLLAPRVFPVEAGSEAIMSYQFSNTIYETPTERIARLVREADPFWAVRHAGADWSFPTYELLDFGGGESIEVLPALPVVPVLPVLPVLAVEPDAVLTLPERRECCMKQAGELARPTYDPVKLPWSGKHNPLILQAMFPLEVTQDGRNIFDVSCTEDIPKKHFASARGRKGETNSVEGEISRIIQWLSVAMPESVSRLLRLLVADGSLSPEEAKRYAVAHDTKAANRRS
jgi:hypothetical protein